MQIFSAQSLFPGMEEELINDVFDRFGPTPRLCIEYAHEQAHLHDYKDKLRETISELTIEHLERLFKDSRSLSMNAHSQKICLINRKGDLPGQTVVTTITRFIEQRLGSQFRKMTRADQICLYQRFAKVPDSSALAGILFEAAGQGQLQDGIKLDIMPMVRLSESRQGSLPQWHSGPLVNKLALDESRQQDLEEQIKINIPEPEVAEYGDGGLLSITANILYLPQSTNQVALDSFILFEKFLYIFHFAVGEKHDIKSGLVDWLGRCSGVPPMTHWRFVFVMEPNQHLTCPQPRSLNLRKLQPFSAVMTLEVMEV